MLLRFSDMRYDVAEMISDSYSYIAITINDNLPLNVCASLLDHLPDVFQFESCVGSW